MATFRFSIDQKCSVWQRGLFDIEAETYEQAKELAKNQIVIDEIKNGSSKKGYLHHWTTLWETLNDFDLKDNDGQPTMEIYSDDNAGELVVSNKPL